MNDKQAIDWLEALAKYFETLDNHGEDLTHWSNIANANTARKIAKLIVDTKQN